MHKFLVFLESLRSTSNNSLVDSIEQAYSLIFEVGEPRKVKGARSFKRMKDKDTVFAYEQFGKKFKTSAGNTVELVFRPYGDQSNDDSFEAIFFVNGSLDDDATVGRKRDPEILSGVTYYIKQIADKKGINTISIQPHKGAGDTKTVRGIDTGDMKSEILRELNKFEESLKKAEYPTEPDESIKKIFDKMGKEWNAYDTYMKGITGDITRLKNILSGEVDPEMGDYIKQIAMGLRLKPVVTNVEQPDKLQSLLTRYGEALMSNSEGGLQVTENRRTKVYDKLLKRNMTGWNVEIDGDNFILTR